MRKMVWGMLGVGVTVVAALAGYRIFTNIPLEDYLEDEWWL